MKMEEMSHTHHKRARCRHTNTARRNRKRTLISLTSCCLLLLLVILCEPLITHRTLASGVFEFQLSDLVRLDQTSPLPIGTKQQQPHQARTLLLHVCLREAFASQLDGPCAYGNTTLTFNQLWARPSSSSISTSQQTDRQGLNGTSISARASDSAASGGDTAAPPFDHHQEQDEQDNDDGHERRGSQQQMTNIVRMPFTFRWTKSFTIILTAEEITNGGLSTAGQIAPNGGPPKPQTAGEVSSATTNDEGIHSQQQQPLQEPHSHTRGQLSRSPSFNGAPLQEQTSSPSPSNTNQHKSSPATTTTTTNLATVFIDRHVLTENGVVPASGARASKLWMDRSSRSSRLAIHYKFRVSCAPHYYGDGCMAFCRPRDDQFGHYQCSSTGQRVCAEGWLGKDCSVARCKQGCNQQHGYCDQPGVCLCRPGWTGARCDECIAYPGCQNGYCLSPWECKCHSNWGGPLCDQDLNYCGSHDPCLNNGTCQNVAPGRYKCACPEGFTGANCEVRLALIDLTSSLTQLSAGCVLNPCLNGGTCIGFNSALLPPAMNQHEADQPRSSAAMMNAEQEAINSDQSSSLEALNGSLHVAPVAGEQDEQTEEQLLSNKDANKDDANKLKQQQQQQQIYRCQCPAGWTGDFCQWAEAAASLIPFPEVWPPHTTTANQTAWPPFDDHSITTKTNSTSSSHTQPPVSDSDNLLQLPADVVFISVGHQSDHDQAARNNSQTDAGGATQQQQHQLNNKSILSITNRHGFHHHQQVPMGHLISGVVIASAVGVFCAALLLAWCCLVAIEKGRFHFIQMNVIQREQDDDRSSTYARSSSYSSSSSNAGNHQSNNVSSTLRRVHEKIRDSFKRSSRSNKIKPETKLSIENCLRPAQQHQASKMPPSYEESHYYTLNKMSNYTNKLDLCQSRPPQPPMCDAIKLDITYKEPTHDDQMQILYDRGHGNNNSNSNNRNSQSGGADTHGITSKGASSFSLSPPSSTVSTAASLSVTHNTCKESLVKRGALEQEIAQKKSQSPPKHHYRNSNTTPLIEKPSIITNAQMNCPKHGHLYRSVGLIMNATDHHQHQHQPLGADHNHHHDQARSRNIYPLPRKTSPDRV